jgi:hypothetical protein
MGAHTTERSQAVASLEVGFGRSPGKLALGFLGRRLVRLGIVQVSFMVSFIPGPGCRIAPWAANAFAETFVSLGFVLQ